MDYVFGPVPSRRLGNSLGVDLVPFKTCTFDCVYCQLGRTTEQTTLRRRFVPMVQVVEEVVQVVDSGVALDYITLSGNGEPTLSLDFGRVIRAIKKFTTVPVAVLTNSSLLTWDDVREDLGAADLVVPSFDAGTQEAFERVNRPLDVSVSRIARGIREFTQGFGGRVWLEVMIVAGLNDSVAEAQAIVAGLEGARFDKVQLNTVLRAPAEALAGAATEERLAELAAVLEALAPVEIIGVYAAEDHPDDVGAGRDVDEAIVATLARRPCRTAELAASLGLATALVSKHIAHLEQRGLLERIVVDGEPQFRARQQP